MFSRKWGARGVLVGTASWLSTVVFAASAVAQTVETPADETLVADEIIIRGEKLSRDLNETIASVTVLDGEELVTSGEQGVYDVLEGRPNVVPQAGGSVITAVRGVDGTGSGFGFGAFLTGGWPRFTTFVDGVPQSVNFLTPLQSFGAWNVDQIEVFRGSQTTLQGRNAVAGSMYITTLDPSFTPEFRLTVDGALQPGHEGGFGRVSALATGALMGDSLAGLVSIEGTLGQSFIDFTDRTASPGFDVEKLQSYNLRGTLLFTPELVPDFTARLTYNRFDEQAPIPLDTGPGRFENIGGFNAAQLLIQGDSVALDLEYDFGGGLSIQNVFTALSQDTDQLSDSAFFQSSLEVDSLEFSNDLRLVYQGEDERTYFLLGGYFYTRERDEVDPGALALNASDQVDNYAVYGEGRFNFGGPVDFILGARYDHEEQERTGFLGPVNIGFSATSSEFLPMGGVLYHHSEDITFGATVRTGYLPGGAGA